MSFDQGHKAALEESIAERPVKDVVFLGTALVFLLSRVLAWAVADRVRGQRGVGACS